MIEVIQIFFIIVLIHIHIPISTHICILYSPSHFLAVLAYRMVIWSNSLKNGLIEFSEKFPVIPEV